MSILDGGNAKSDQIKEFINLHHFKQLFCKLADKFLLKSYCVCFGMNCSYQMLVKCFNQSISPYLYACFECFESSSFPRSFLPSLPVFSFACQDWFLVRSFTIPSIAPFLLFPRNQVFTINLGAVKPRLFHLIQYCS